RNGQKDPSRGLLRPAERVSLSWFQLFRMPNTSRSRPARHRGLFRTTIFIRGTAFLFCSIISKTGPECDSALRDAALLRLRGVRPGLDHRKGPPAHRQGDGLRAGGVLVADP